jgi:hypothetical protein
LGFRHLEQIDLRYRAGDIEQGIDLTEGGERLIRDLPGGRNLGKIEIEDQRRCTRRRDGGRVSSRFFRSRATSVMAEKSLARRTAVARPIPWLAPVTMATDLDIRILPWLRAW